MTTASESLGHGGNIHVTSTPKTHFHSSVPLFVSDERTFNTDDPKTLVDHVFGIGRNGTGVSEVVPSCGQPSQATIASQLDSFQQSAG